MSDIVLQGSNPDGTLHAVLDQDGRCMTLWLEPSEALRDSVKTRMTWVRNLVPPPARFDPTPARDGLTPLQPASHARDEGFGPLPDPTRLSLVWLQEGDGVALLEDDDLLAVLPSWCGAPGRDEPPGFSADAVGQGPMGWSLDEAVDLVDRVRADQDWWDGWDHDPFTPWRDALNAAVEEQIGPVGRYFAIDGARWPPRAMVLADRPPGRVAVTLGMSIRRQPQAERWLGDHPGRRIELAMAIHPSVEAPRPWLKALASLAGLPWRRCTWLGSGHTASPAGLPAPFGSLLLHPSPPEGVELGLPDHEGEPVQVLWCTAITAAERALAQEFGRDKLAERLGPALGQVMRRSPVA